MTPVDGPENQDDAEAICEQQKAEEIEQPRAPEAIVRERGPQGDECPQARRDRRPHGPDGVPKAIWRDERRLTGCPVDGAWSQ